MRTINCNIYLFLLLNFISFLSFSQTKQKYFSQRPQVQERLTRQIMENLKQTLNIDDVAVVIDARHMCVECRGVEDVTSSTITSAISGQFQEDSTRSEFMRFIGM